MSTRPSPAPHDRSEALPTTAGLTNASPDRASVASAPNTPDGSVSDPVTQILRTDPTAANRGTRTGHRTVDHPAPAMSSTTLTQRFHRNPRMFGRQLRRRLWSDGGLALLPGGGEIAWNDGGCLLLADALARILTGAEHLAVTFDHSVLGQHFLVRVGHWHLDADGACLAGSLRRRWERYEAPRGARVDVVPIAEAVISPATCGDAVLSAGIASYLTTTLS